MNAFFWLYFIIYRCGQTGEAAGWSFEHRTEAGHELRHKRSRFSPEHHQCSYLRVRILVLKASTSTFLFEYISGVHLWNKQKKKKHIRMHLSEWIYLRSLRYFSFQRLYLQYKCILTYCTGRFCLNERQNSLILKMCSLKILCFMQCCLSSKFILRIFRYLDTGKSDYGSAIS